MPRQQTSLDFDELLKADFLDEGHIEAFSHALQFDESYFDNSSQVPSPHPSGTPSSHGRIRKISALSDFAPVNLRVRKRNKKDAKAITRHDWTYLVFRWPLLLLIFGFIMLQFGCYVVIRQLVNAKEWLVAWRGHKGQLRRNLRAAKTYEEWKEAAAALDKYLKFDQWKKVDEDQFYDWTLVRKVKRSLKTFRENGDVRGCMGVLQTCIRSNFAAIESSRLYSETFLGTKNLIESYIDELETCLEFVRESPELSVDEKKKFFKSVNMNLGISALCLSGGAALGYYHFGVLRAFVDAGVLPRVLSGTSAGGLMAAMACTHTDEELKTLLVPEMAVKITAFSDSMAVWAQRLLRTGARFDSVDWARKATFFTRGSTTFKEAYLRTGRILNVSVIPVDRHSPTKILNYINAPDTVIWSALLASAAVPGILNPVVLMQKTREGNLIPWNWGSKWRDGSFRVDIPIQALNQYFNVTYPVVSQVNPHVHLFFFSPRGTVGRPVARRKGKGDWRGNFLLSAAEQWLKHELTKNFRVIRDLELLPPLLGQDWSNVFLQRFEGIITIWPRTRLRDFIRILSDPDEEEFARLLHVGKYVTWPKIHMISNRARIERQILLGRQAVHRATASRSRPTSQEPRQLVERHFNEVLPMKTPGGLLSSPLSQSDVPLSVDTDVEVAYPPRSRQGQPSRLPGDTAPLAPHQRDDGQESLPSTRQRKLISDYLNSAEGEDGQEEGSEQTTPHGSRPESESGGGFLMRLRSRSLLHPFADHENEVHRPASPHSTGEQADANGWTSDSSSEDEFALQLY